MNFMQKLGIASGGVFVFMSLFGFVLFPMIIKSAIKAMVNLNPGTDLRDLFVKLPFPVHYNIYIFNVTNPMQVQEGNKPILQQLGPYCYEEWKEKTNVRDNEADDTMYYNMKDTFYPRSGSGCASLEEEVTIPHPVILGILNNILRASPVALKVISKGINSIFDNPKSVYLTAKVGNLLFDGIKMECNSKEGGGRFICPQAAQRLKVVSEGVLEFSLFNSRNGTESLTFKVQRGKKDYRKVGQILEYGGQKKLNVWNADPCNTISGTDGTVVPPFLKKEHGIVVFASEMCRSLRAVYEHDTEYNGIPVRFYTVSLGDMSAHEDERCFCYSADQCLKKGVLDLYYCAGIALIASLPHFYDSDQSYVNQVEGLSPNKEDHGIRILSEPLTGSPISARKRLQINIPFVRSPEVEILANIPELFHPVVWIEEAVELPKDVIKPIKMLYLIKKIMKIITWMVIIASLATIGVVCYHIHKQGGLMNSKGQKVEPTKAAIEILRSISGYDEACANGQKK